MKPIHALAPFIFAIGLASAPLETMAAQAQVLEHLDFDDRDAPFVAPTREVGKARLVEFRDFAPRRRAFTLRTLGEGVEPRLARERDGTFLRFEAHRSSVRRDRSEIIIDQHLAENRPYSLSFRLRLPESGRGIFLSDNQWFMITQVQEVGEQGTPPLSINLRRDPDGVYIDLVGRNDRDAYRRLAYLRLDDLATFSFDEWNDVELTFLMGPRGYAELAIANTTRRLPLRSTGPRPARLTFDRGEQRYVLRMGLYRGGQPRDRYYIDMDDIVFATP